jgi:hypothetical protein
MMKPVCHVHAEGHAVVLEETLEQLVGWLSLVHVCKLARLCIKSRVVQTAAPWVTFRVPAGRSVQTCTEIPGCMGASGSRLRGWHHVRAKIVLCSLQSGGTSVGPADVDVDSSHYKGSVHRRLPFSDSCDGGPVEDAFL